MPGYVPMCCTPSRRILVNIYVFGHLLPSLLPIFVSFFLVANDNLGEMSTANLNWNQVEITETISEAFRNKQTLADNGDDAWLWSKTPLEQFRSRIDAEVYLDGLFNEIHTYLERKNQIPIEAVQNPKNCICSPQGFGRSVNHGKSCTDSKWSTHRNSQSDVVTLEDVEIRIIAAARLRQSIRDICSWAPGHSSDCNSSKEGRSTWGELMRTFATSVRDLQSENDELSHQLAKMRQNSTMIVDSTVWPMTLRTSIMMRVMEANFGQPTRINDQTLLSTKIGHLSSICINALDVTLTPDRANQLGHFLPSGAAYTNLYHGIHLHNCIKCFKPRFRLNKANRYPLFRDLNEYPKLGDFLSFGEICSSCGLETLLRAIWRDWWRSPGNIHWLKHDWDQSCCSSEINSEEALRSVLKCLRCQDVNDVDDYIKNFQKATKYRAALKRLDRRPNATELDAAADLHAHLIKRGRMRNFFHAPIDPEVRQHGVVPKFCTGPIIIGGIGYDNLKIPIFSNLLRRQRTPKECIVCTENKNEVDYGTLDQWKEDCAEHTGMWMWSVFEYPTCEIQQCGHALDVCRACMAQHISTSIESGELDRIACPQCSRVLSFEEIRNLAEADTFERYDKILLRRALSSDPNFRWCLSPTCENGQIHEDVDMSLAAVQCEECGFRMCFRHQRPWHSGMTCAEFDSSCVYGDPKFLQTQEFIMNNTKACPNCRARIEKGPGCFHMTCSSCRHEFCWECLADWRSVRDNRLAHNVGCFFRDNAVHPTAILGTDLQAALQAR